LAPALAGVIGIDCILALAQKKQLILAKAFKNSNYTPPLQLKLEAINFKKN
jgi:hypothetical protein